MAKGRGKAKLSEDELKAIVDWELNDAIGRHDGELSEQRRRSLEFYFGEFIGNEVEGRSQIISHDVFEVIEWAMPHLVRVFMSNDNVALFEPRGPEDEEEAEQATDYVNYLFNKRCNGFHVLNTMFKDALLEKTGVVKVWWDDTEEVSREDFTGLDDFAFAKLVSDEDIEVVEHTESQKVIETPQGPAPITIHDCVVERTKSRGRIQVEPIPPEEFLVSKRARDLDEAMFVAHRTRKSISEIKEMFPGTKDSLLEEIVGDNEQDWDEEYTARHDFDDVQGGDPGHGNQWLGRRVWITESYIHVDWDNDGYAELRKITKAGNLILENVEVDERPFASVCPIPVPHKYYGLSLADKTKDIQIVKSTLLRNILDNIYNLNNGRFEAVEGQVNFDDLLTSRPGGVVRVKQKGAVTRLDTPPLPNGGFELLGYVDQVRDGRTGISKFRTGLDANQLNNAKATPANNQMDAANARLELMARTFAETGVKRIFQLIYNNVVKHQNHSDMIKLRNKWVPIDPSNWKGNVNVDISVGLGHGNRDQTVAHMGLLAQHYTAMRQDPEFKDMVKRDNVYNMVKESLSEIGYRNTDKFITNPSSLPPYQAQPTPEQQALQAKGESEKMRGQAAMMKAQADTQKGQQDGQNTQMDMQLKVQGMQMDKEKQSIDIARMQAELQGETQKFELEKAKLQTQLVSEMEQNKVEQAKTQIEFEKVVAEKEKLAVEMQMKEAEFALKVEELKLEREQERSVKIGE